MDLVHGFVSVTFSPVLSKCFLFQKQVSYSRGEIKIGRQFTKVVAVCQDIHLVYHLNFDKHEKGKSFGINLEQVAPR